MGAGFDGQRTLYDTSTEAEKVWTVWSISCSMARSSCWNALFSSSRFSPWAAL